MHVIIVLAQSPKTIGHTVYGADNVFVLIKRAVFRGTKKGLKIKGFSHQTEPFLLAETVGSFRLRLRLAFT